MPAPGARSARGCSTSWKRARDHRVATLRLDTRRDLVEAHQLSARHGYTEVRPFSHGPYSDHWFVKDGPFGT